LIRGGARSDPVRICKYLRLSKFAGNLRLDLEYGTTTPLLACRPFTHARSNLQSDQFTGTHLTITLLELAQPVPLDGLAVASFFARSLETHPHFAEAADLASAFVRAVVTIVTSNPILP